MMCSVLQIINYSNIFKNISDILYTMSGRSLSSFGLSSNQALERKLS